MITIDLNKKLVSQPEKPSNRKIPTSNSVDIGRYDPVYSVIRKQHQDLLRASYTARMLKHKEKEGLAVEVQRYIKKVRVEVFTLAARYAGRAG